MNPRFVKPALPVPRLEAVLPMAAALVLVGCGSLADESHSGKALATIRGTMGASANVAIEGPISLAVLWMPELQGVEGNLGEQSEAWVELPDGTRIPVEPGCTGDTSVDGSHGGTSGAGGSGPGQDCSQPGEPDQPNQPGQSGQPDPFGGPGGLGCTGEPSSREVDRQVFHNERWVSQPLTFDAKFPIQFELSMTALPPREVRLDLSTVGGSGEMSAGFLIAYIDTNENGTFDPGRPGVPGDRVLATSGGFEEPSHVLIYLNGHLPARVDGVELVRGTVPQGFSVLRSQGIDPELSSSEPYFEVLPRDASLSLSLDASTTPASFSHLACASVEYVTEIGGEKPTAIGHDCSEDNRLYGWFGPLASDDPCRIVSSTGYACLGPDSAVPSDWPCQ